MLRVHCLEKHTSCARTVAVAVGCLTTSTCSNVPASVYITAASSLSCFSVQSVDLSAEDLQQALRHLLSRCSPGATAWHCRLREAASKAVELAEAKGPTAAAALKEAADAVVVVQRFSVQVQSPFFPCPLFHLS